MGKRLSQWMSGLPDSGKGNEMKNRTAASNERRLYFNFKQLREIRLAAVSLIKLNKSEPNRSKMIENERKGLKWIEKIEMSSEREMRNEK